MTGETGAPAPRAANVLFACVHNSGRSQMSQAFFEAAAPKTGLTARSAGTEPGDAVDPAVREVMSEVGIDMGGHKPTLLDRRLAEWADLVVTMGCGDSCPYVPGTSYVDWDLDDPEGLPLEDVRLIRDEIRRRVGTLIGDLAGQEPPPDPDAR